LKIVLLENSSNEAIGAAENLNDIENLNFSDFRFRFIV